MNCQHCHQPIRNGDVLDAVSGSHWECEYPEPWPVQYEQATLGVVYRDKPLWQLPSDNLMRQHLVDAGLRPDLGPLERFNIRAYREHTYHSLPRWRCRQAHGLYVYSMIQVSECLEYESLVVGRYEQHYVVWPRYPWEGHRAR